MEIEIIKCKRKSIAIQLKKPGVVTVRAPYRMSKKDILAFVNSKQSWIDKHMNELIKRQEEAGKIRPLSNLELEELINSAKWTIPNRVQYYAPIVGVDCGRITIRRQKSRWGSCSAKGNLNFNVALMRAPLDVLDYVVVHELCHRIEMNHSAAFWANVARVLPDYKKQEQWLKEHGDAIMAEVHGI